MGWSWCIRTCDLSCCSQWERRECDDWSCWLSHPFNWDFRKVNIRQRPNKDILVWFTNILCHAGSGSKFSTQWWQQVALELINPSHSLGKEFVCFFLHCLMDSWSLREKESHLSKICQYMYPLGWLHLSYSFNLMKIVLYRCFFSINNLPKNFLMNPYECH